MAVVAVIPARYASSRFPAKPLAAETGKPLIQHVWERVCCAARVDRVIVATDDDRIAAAVAAFGGEARMTRADHPNGTYRVAEVAAALRLTDNDLVLNVQGDEPELDPAVLDRLIARMTGARAGAAASPPAPTDSRDLAASDATRAEAHAAEVDSRACGEVPGMNAGAMKPGTLDAGARDAGRSVRRCDIGTLACPFPADSPTDGPGSPRDPNCVKVVLDAAGRALYFSRSLLPYPRGDRGMVLDPSRWRLHLGVYAFRPAALAAVTRSADESPLARLESLEQLAWLEDGWTIAVEIVPPQPPGVDTPEDYAAFVARVRRPGEVVQTGG